MQIVRARIMFIIATV